MGTCDIGGGFRWTRERLKTVHRERDNSTILEKGKGTIAGKGSTTELRGWENGKGGGELSCILAYTEPYARAIGPSGKAT